MRTRIKICGITCAEDAAAAVAAGADALGLIFFPQSRRMIGLDQAAAVAREVPAMVDLIGVFVDPSEGEIARVLDRIPLTLLQFHGAEPAVECDRSGLPYIKAIRMRDGIEIDKLPATYPNAGAFLLDTYHAEAVGGTGVSFDWRRARVNFSAPVILAGGLEPHNVSQALDQSGAWAVDVSTGVEVEPGRKSAEKIQAFCQAVYAWDTQATQRMKEGNGA
ncbi:MAG TPA: phosphoribosylanthranilate isomerase [Gammaproteobacteria bacterium]|nr:phosphoribosylanthranilate isomerase [Gammaproteobacteria bacterium]